MLSSLLDDSIRSIDYWPWIYENKATEKVRQSVNRTRGFVNLNRFKSSQAIKRLSKVSYGKHKGIREGGGRDKGQQG